MDIKETNLLNLRQTMRRAECNLTLDELLDFEGVREAGIFSPEGKLVEYKSKADMPKEMAQMTAKFCGVVNMMFDALASAYTQLYKMNWIPQQSWMYSGGDWTVIIAGNRGVFVETAKADLENILESLGVC
jgi:roadblock/LC7 domain-containing protein